MPGARRHQSGFTIIELLVAVAIVGTLASIAGTNYMGFVERARVVGAISDIKNISTAIKGFEVAEDRLPNDLDEVDFSSWIDPWGNPYEYVPLNGAGPGGGGGGGGPPVQPRKDRFLVPINSDFDLYSAGKDGRTAAPLTAAQSRDDVIRAGNGSFIGLAERF